MARVIWKGSISFGLVHIPVALYPAQQRNELQLTMLDRRDHAPLGYKRINKETGAEVPWEQVVKAYEYEKNQYVILGEEDFRQANVKATQTIEIISFVSTQDIPLTYFDTPYYIEPIYKGEKVYALLREVLRRSAKAGIAKVVLHTRQHLAALIPDGNMLLLNLLRFHYELRDPSKYHVPGEDLKALGITAREVEMAERLMDEMVEPWNPENYRDEYYDDLMRLVDKKIKSGQTEALEPNAEEAPQQGAEIIDLMALLKRSMHGSEKQSREKLVGRRAAPKWRKNAARSPSNNPGPSKPARRRA